MNQNWSGARISTGNGGAAGANGNGGRGGDIGSHNRNRIGDTHKSWSYAGDHVEGDQSNFGTYNDIGGNQTNNTNTYGSPQYVENDISKSRGSLRGPVLELQSKGVKTALRNLAQFEKELDEEIERAEEELVIKQAEVERMRQKRQMLKQIKDELQTAV